MRQHALWWLLLLMPVVALLSFACQPARRFPPPPPVEEKTEEKTKPTPPADFAWIEPSPRYDIPIVFVPDTAKEWADLPAYWNLFPPPPAGLPTCYLGLSPIGAVAALALVEPLAKIKIKVPLGLPDPTPFIPKANPPTYQKWKLGKSLFFDEVLSPSKFDRLACAKCHDPKKGFTEDAGIHIGARKNTPSLINCVYNKHQFWDGRAAFLEQAIVRELDDETIEPKERPERHVWGGLVKVLRDHPVYKSRFQEVFGVRPTQDTIAKALATYMRTILSGNSLYDRAAQERNRLGDAELSAKHFEAVLDDAGVKGLGLDNKADAARDLDLGQRLFHGKARCHLCHPKPLFSDHDFHNIGLTGTDAPQLSGEKLGRFAHVPGGLKETRLKGAYKTPTLRDLPRTAPYMHDGRFDNLAEVVSYFNNEISGEANQFLAPQLRDGRGQARKLDLEQNDIRVLVLFLRALDGDAVDPVVAAAPK